jgi:hypothetical protein
MPTSLIRPEAKPSRRDLDSRLDPVGSRRRPALAVGSIALVVACLAVFVSVYMKAGSQVSVLALTRAVAQGQVLTASDLTAVRMSVTSRIESVPAAAAGTVVGRRAAELLEPNTLLTANEVVTSFAPPAGESVVGVALKDGQLPASGVAPGETVEVILTGQPGEQDSTVVPDSTENDPSAAASGSTASDPTGTAGSVLVPDAIVLETAVPTATSESGAVDVSLLTPSSLAPFVASASVAGDVAVIIVKPKT